MSRDAYMPLIDRARKHLHSLAEHFSDNKMSQYPLILALAHKIDRPPSALAHSLLLLFLSVLLLNPIQLSGLTVNSIGLLWPTVLTVNHLASLDHLNPSKAHVKSTKEWAPATKRLVDYWVIYSTSVFLETALGEETLLDLWPIWWAMKGLVIVCTMVTMGARKERARPKPLNLRPRNTKPQNVLALQPQLAEMPHTSYADDESSSSASSHTGACTTAIGSAPEPTSAQVREMQQAFQEVTPPPLSQTPVNMKSIGHGSDSEPFGLNSESGESDSAESDSGSGSSTESDSPPSPANKPLRGLDERPARSRSSSSSSAAAGSDDSNDAILPPGTPLDELALRGLQTRQIVGTEPEPSREEDARVRENRDVFRFAEEKVGPDVGLGKAVFPVLTDDPRPIRPSPPAPLEPDTNPLSSPPPLPSPGPAAARPAATPDFTRPGVQADHAARAIPLSTYADHVREGQVTRLALDDLLDMDDLLGTEDALGAGSGDRTRKSIGVNDTRDDGEGMGGVELAGGRKYL